MEGWRIIWLDAPHYNYELLDTTFEKKEDYNDNPFDEEVSYYSSKGEIIKEKFPILISEID